MTCRQTLGQPKHAVVGFTPGGKPIYDGAWLDKVLDKPGNFTIKVKHDPR